MTQSKQATQQKITILFGYGLFFITLVALAMNMLIWATTPDQPQSLHFNILITMGAFALAIILPTLAGYFVGDRATRRTSALTHRYNGVLFGVLGFWLVNVAMGAAALIDMSGLFVSIPSLYMGSIVPAGIALLVLVICGVLYVRETNYQTTVLNYQPYRVVLIASVATIFIASGITIATGVSNGADALSSFAVLFLPALMIAIIVFFGSWLLGVGNGTFVTRLTKSIVGLSYGIVAATFIGQALLFAPAIAPWSVVVGIAVWVAYIVLLRRYAATSK